MGLSAWFAIPLILTVVAVSIWLWRFVPDKWGHQALWLKAAIIALILGIIVAIMFGAFARR